MLKRLSIFNKTADQNSSDDDDSSSKDGKEGNFADAIVFKSYCIKTDRQKEFHLDLYRCLARLCSSNKSKVFHCDSIQRVLVNSEKNQVIVERKLPSELLSKQRKYVFETIALAQKFKMYVECCKSQGNSIRYMFDMLDPSKLNSIHPTYLMRTLKEFHIPFTEIDIAGM